MPDFQRMVRERLRDCGLPDGVFQVATGDGSTGGLHTAGRIASTSCP